MGSERDKTALLHSGKRLNKSFDKLGILVWENGTQVQHQAALVNPAHDGR